MVGRAKVPLYKMAGNVYLMIKTDLSINNEVVCSPISS
jgi:hypothetical protein